MNKIARTVQQYRTAKQKHQDERTALKQAKIRAEASVEAQKIVQGIAVAVQQQAHEQIAKVVTRCIRAVFVERWEFRIVFERKRGKTEARFAFFLKDREYDPKEGSAGGVVDVAAFGLRLACLLLQTPQRRKVLIMDEPFKNINGSANQERAGALIEALSEETGVQMIIVTDDEWLKIGKVVQVG